MRFPAKITSSCIWVAIPVDWAGMPVVRTDGRAYGHVITKFSRMGRLPDFLTHGAPQARFARQSSAISGSSGWMRGQWVGHEWVTGYLAPEKLYWQRTHHVTCNCLQLLNSVITKYRDLSVSRGIIDLLATDKSRYFAQPRLICVRMINILVVIMDTSWWQVISESDSDNYCKV